jgi:hypothetical protein
MGSSISGVGGAAGEVLFAIEKPVYLCTQSDKSTKAAA